MTLKLAKAKKQRKNRTKVCNLKKQVKAKLLAENINM